MALQGVLLCLALIVLIVLAFLPGEITRGRVEKRLKDLGKKRGSHRNISWREDFDSLCDERLGRYRLYTSELSRMQKAGFLEHWQTGAFLLAQVGFVFLGIIVGFILKDLDFQNLQSAVKSILGSLLIAILFAAAPRLWLVLKTNENLKKLRKAMPIAVELMTICMESGNGLEQTFEKVGNELMGTNPQVASRLLDVRSGMVAYDRKWALQKLERESFFEEEKELARSLLESLQYGTPLVNALRSLAQRMREENMNRLEEVAGKASTKMTIPMILFLMVPVVVLMLAEPIIQFLRNSL
jgi:tight adherence protein C